MAGRCQLHDIDAHKMVGNDVEELWRDIEHAHWGIAIAGGVSINGERGIKQRHQEAFRSVRRAR